MRPCLLLLLTLPLRAQILPPPPEPAGNPSTPDKVLLGKALFWDEQLSSSRTIACGTCHVFAHGGSDPRTATSLHPGPDGIAGTADDVHGSPGVVRLDASRTWLPDPTFGLQPQVTRRRAPSPINAAWARDLFVDGRAGPVFTDPVTGAVVLPAGAALESQIANPPVHPVEMAHAGRTWTDVAQDLAPSIPLRLATRIPPPLAQFIAGRTYDDLFAQVYGSPGVTPVRIIFAIAAYERSLVSDQSPFDRWRAGLGTLGSAELAGLATFQQRCAGCHTDLDAAVLTTGPVLDDFRNIGLRPVAEDPGRFLVTGAAADRGRFRVPGLRNVALRGPWFHNGGTTSLFDVISFYARGGDVHDNQDPLVAALVSQISMQDRLFLQALLASLTDPRVAGELPPFDRPRLWSEGPDRPRAFGAGTAAAAGMPVAVAPFPAFAGNTAFALGLDRITPTAAGFLVLDTDALLTPQSTIGVEVWLALSPRATALAAPMGTSWAPGLAATTLAQPIPAAPALTGLAVHGQWLVVDPLAPPASSAAFTLSVF